MRLVWGRVQSIDRDSESVQWLTVDVDGTSAAAVGYPPLTGSCVVGEPVLLNTTAVDLQLGSGGVHFVVARGAEGSASPAFEHASGGHIMKMRYTPLQVDVRTVEEQGGDSHEVMARVTDVGGMPVACCGLHSQVPLVAAAVKESDPTCAVAFVMTDSASLPLAFSNVIREGVDAGLIDVTVSCGQAFGGMLEAVNLHSGLLAARHLAGGDVAIVGPGPGIVGTATPLGHGGVAQGEAINAAFSLGGRPVAVLRLSSAETRERHKGVSHHTLAALTTIALAPAVVAVPLPSGQGADDTLGHVESVLEQAGVWGRHTRVPASGARPDSRGVTVTTMGRGLGDDPLFFAAAYAAGYVCADLRRAS